jgi:hypothetical protein
MTKSQKKVARRGAAKAAKGAARKGTLKGASKKPAARAVAMGSAKKPSKLASLKNMLLGKADAKKPAAPQTGKLKATPGKATVASKTKPVAAAKGKIASAPAKQTKTPAAAAKLSSAAKAGAAKIPAAKAAELTKPQKAAKAPKLPKGSSEAKALKAAARAVNGGSRSAEDCREVACEGLATSAGYCRLHYIKNWKKIQRKVLILKEGKLNQYIEELVAKYPDKYIEAIRQDLANDKDFAKVIYDLDLDESVDEFDVDGENLEGVIDSIKPSFEDEGGSDF